MSPTSIDPRLGPIDFDALRQQMRDAPGFPHFCVDGFLEPSFAGRVAAGFPSYAEATTLGRSFCSVNEYRKTQIVDPARFTAPVRELYELLMSDAFVAQMSAVSGIDGLVADPTLVGGGIHETAGGGRLDVHVDFNVNARSGMFRRLNVLLYFNEDWRPAYGGDLDLWNRDVTRCIGRFAPLFNRAAGFVTGDHSWHGVTPVRCPLGTARKSFAVYYYTAEPPPGWDGVERSTVFRPRPAEHWRGKVAMPAQDVLRAGRRAAVWLKSRVRKLVYCVH